MVIGWAIAVLKHIVKAMVMKNPERICDCRLSFDNFLKWIVLEWLCSTKRVCAYFEEWDLLLTWFRCIQYFIIERKIGGFLFATRIRGWNVSYHAAWCNWEGLQLLVCCYVGQTPSWILSRTAYPAFLIAWWLTFCCPTNLHWSIINYATAHRALCAWLLCSNQHSPYCDLLGHG